MRKANVVLAGGELDFSVIDTKNVMQIGKYDPNTGCWHFALQNS